MDFSGIKFEKVIFNNSVFEKGVSFNNVHFKEEVDFTETIFTGKVTFEWAKFSNSAYFTRSTFVSTVDFSNSHFLQRVEFSDSKFKNKTIFDNVVFDDDALFEAVVICKSVYFNSAHFNGSVFFSKSRFHGSVRFIEADFADFVYFSESIFHRNADFRMVKVSDKIFFNDTQFKGKTDFRSSELLGNCFFNYIKVIDEGEIDFWLTRFGEYVEFIGSSIKKSSFRGVIFQDVANFTDCHLQETNFDGALFKEFGTFRKCKIDKANRETYRIVKHEQLKLSNKIDALISHKMEMKEYWRELWDKKSTNNFPERVILFLNQYSNDYGLSWIRGISFTFMAAILFFIPYILWGLNEPYYQWGWDGWSAFWEVSGITVKSYVEFLYAAHKFNFMEQYQPNGFGYVLDMAGRVFITYGYYQTIQAFRKYGRW